jgi:hypothetical protein
VAGSPRGAWAALCLVREAVARARPQPRTPSAPIAGRGRWRGHRASYRSGAGPLPRCWGGWSAASGARQADRCQPEPGPFRPSRRSSATCSSREPAGQQPVPRLGSRHNRRRVPRSQERAAHSCAGGAAVPQAGTDPTPNAALLGGSRAARPPLDCSTPPDLNAALALPAGSRWSGGSPDRALTPAASPTWRRSP